MVTLCSFSNPIEAGLAKSRLDDRQIFCSLADENVDQLGGAPLAMPVRLLVAEDQVEEARRILAETDHPLRDDFISDPIAQPPNDPPQRILDELRALKRGNHWIGLGVVVVLVLTIYFVSEFPRRTTSPGEAVSSAIRRYDYPAALQLARALTARDPNDYYGHEYLASIYARMGDLEQAEKEYSRAIELSPPQSLQSKLDAVRARRNLESSRASPAATP